MARILQRRSTPTLDKGNLWKIVERLRVIDEEMRLRNSESLIPEVVTLPPDKNLHDRMNNCHVIESKFLGLIRKGPTYGGSQVSLPGCRLALDDAAQRAG